MRFELDADQRDFATALDSLLSGADAVGAARAWAGGDHGPGLKLWSRLADLGVTSLATDATPVEVTIAFEALGRHAVPGPWVESAAYLPVALGQEVDGIATVALPPHVPYALDADVADHVYVGNAPADSVGERIASVDPTRHLFPVTGEGEPSREGFDLAVLATAAQLLGAEDERAGEVEADAHVGEVDVSAAKVAAGDAAYRASRTGLQVHGAVGYTQELDLSLWLTKIRALVTAWGTPAYHRSVVLGALVG